MTFSSQLRAGIVAAAVALSLAACSSSSPSADASAASASPTAPSASASPSPSASRASLAEIVARSTVPVLCYHQIRPLTSADGPLVRSLTASPQTFADHVRALKKAGYTSITSEQLYQHLVAGAALPNKPVLITFDDASKGQWSNAGPILQKAGYTATYFIMTVVLNKKNWLSDGDISQMHKAGFEVASHTWDHYPVTTYDAAKWKVELDGSMKTLQQKIGQPITRFAYPYGAWNDKAFAPLNKAGIQLAFQLTDQPVHPKAPLLTQRRLLVDGRWSGDQLVARIEKTFP